MVEPGIKPEEVSVDFGGLARKEELAVAPYALNEDEDYWNSWPTHLAVEHRDFEFRVMTVAGNKNVFKKVERMTALEAALRAQGQGKSADVKKLPYPVYRDGGLNLWTKLQFLEGDGWRGLHWIASLGDDISCTLEMGGRGLGYYFEGISNDGRLFILIRAHVAPSTALAQRFGEDRAWNADMNAVFRKDAAAADPASFQPSLDRLDAVIRSLKLRS
jgi:hypothetical protein